MGRRLGKGLSALLSDSGEEVVGSTNKRALLVEKRRELRENEEACSELRKEMKQIRSRVAVKLMGEGPVDSTELDRLQDELHQKEKVIKDLRKEVQELKDALLVIEEGQTEKVDEPVKEGPAKKDRHELDMRMVSELKPPPVKGVPEGPAGPTEGPKSYDDHLKRLREELSPVTEARALRKEIYRTSPRVEEKVEDEELEEVQEVIGDWVEEAEEWHEVPAKVTAPSRAPLVKRKIARKEPVPAPKTSKVPTAKDPRVQEHIDKAMKKIQAGDLKGAGVILHLGLKQFPLDDELLCHLGNVFFSLGEVSAAEKRFRKAIEVNPNSFRAYNNLGVVLKRLGRKEEAIAAFDTALNINDRYDQAWTNLAVSFMELEPPMLKEAIIFLKRALEISPGNERVSSLLSECEGMLEEE